MKERSLRHSMLLSVMVLSSAALAQTKPSVAAYPLDVLVRGVSDQQVKELQSEARRLLSLEAATPDGLTLDAALVMTERKDCDVEDACLAKFATSAKVLYAVFSAVETDLKQKQVTVKGRVVRDDGVLVVAAKTVTMPVTKKGKDAVDLTVREALKSLYSELKISTLPVAKEVVKKDPDPVKKDPDPIKKDPDVPPPPPPPIVDTGAGQRAAGTAMLIGGVGVAAVGAVLSAVGCGVGCAVPVNNGAVIDRRDIPNLQTGAALMGTGFTAIAIGAGVGVIGSIVLASAPAPVKSVSVVPTAGGAVVQFGGSF
ncbi:MAG: hypothetical protein QM817_22450 [Archangium sp.]